MCCLLFFLEMNIKSTTKNKKIGLINCFGLYVVVFLNSGADSQGHQVTKHMAIPVSLTLY